MNNVIKITKKRQLKALFYFFFGVVVFTFTSIFVSLKFDKNFFAVFTPMFVLFLLPAVFLHIEYYLKNKSEIYKLQNDRIIQCKEGKEKTYAKEDIKKVIIYMSPNYYRNSVYVTGFENYHYALVVLNSGENLYLTSLLAPGGIDKVFDIYLKEIPYLRKKRVFVTTLY